MLVKVEVHHKSVVPPSEKASVPPSWNIVTEVCPGLVVVQAVVGCGATAIGLPVAQSPVAMFVAVPGFK